MKTIFFVISTLSGGGAERVMLNILTHINRVKFRPVLVLFERKGELLSHLPPEIRVETLKRKKAKYGLQWLVFFRLAQLLKKERPEALVSFMWYPNLVSLLAKLLSRSDCKVIVSERSSLSLCYEGRVAEFLRHCTVRFFYRRADAVTVNSVAMAEELMRMFRFPQDRLAVIHNPVDIDRIRRLGREEVSRPWFGDNMPTIAAVGRLSREKGFSYLLAAMKIMVSRGIPCRLILLGRGQEEDSLRDTAKALQIEDRVIFHGFQENPYKYMARSALFVLPSLYEGFPNALLEAMALGVPSIATRCPTGPAEIIRDGVDGILVPSADEKALADAVERLLRDRDLRKKLSEAGKKRVEEFRVETIVRQYEDLIERACAESAVR